MNDFENKLLCFASALQDVYKDEEEKESMNLKLELQEETITEDFTAMIYAQFILYKKITGDYDMDILGFTHLINRLVFQHIDQKQEDN